MAAAVDGRSGGSGSLGVARFGAGNVPRRVPGWSTVKRSVVSLLAAKAVSDVGTAVDFICLVVFVWLRTGSTLATAGVGLVTYGGSVWGGRLAHRFGDRWDRRRAMIAADVARALVLVPMVLLPDAAQLWWLYPAVLVVGIGRSVFAGTLGAAAPVLFGERTLSMNSFM